MKYRELKDRVRHFEESLGFLPRTRDGVLIVPMRTEVVTVDEWSQRISEPAKCFCVTYGCQGFSEPYLSLMLYGWTSVVRADHCFSSAEAAAAAISRHEI